MVTRLQQRRLHRLFISPKRRRELDAQFRAEMQDLHAQLEKPHRRETVLQFAERLVAQLEKILNRYDKLGLLRGLPEGSPRRGRRPLLAKEPAGVSGRPPSALAEDVAKKVKGEGYTVPDAAREVLLVYLEKHDPRRYQALIESARAHRDLGTTYTLTPRRALSHAFGADRNLAALIRTTRNHLKTRHSRDR